MKDGLKEIIGKRISAVVAAESNRSPTTQLFLIFSDETHFEIWGNTFTGAGGVDSGGLVEVQNQMKRSNGSIAGIYQLPKPATKKNENSLTPRAIDLIVALAASILGVLVAVHELLYYFAHPNRPGPALSLAALGAAVALIAIPKLAASSNETRAKA